MVSPPGQDQAVSTVPFHLTAAANSNDTKLKLLERRLTGSLPSPRSISFDHQQLALAGTHHEKSCHGGEEGHAQVEHPPTEARAGNNEPSDAEGEDSRDTFGIFPTGRESKKRKLEAGGELSGLPPLAARAHSDAATFATPRAATATPAVQSRRTPSPSLLQHNTHTSPPLAQGATAQKYSSAVFRTPPGTGKKGTCRNTLHQYFPVLGNDGHSRAEGAPSAFKENVQQSHSDEKLAKPRPAACAAVRSVETQTATESSHSASLQTQLDRQAADYRQKEAAWQLNLQRAHQETAEARSTNGQLEQELKQCRDAAAAKHTKATAAIKRLAATSAMLERELEGFRLRQEGVRLGSVGLAREGALGVREVWEEGQAFRDLAARQTALSEAREQVEAARKAVRRKLPPPEHPMSQPLSSSQASERSGSAGPPPWDFISPEEYVMRDEVFKVRISALKREEDALHKDKERLEVEKMHHLRELKRLKDSEGSRFSDHPMLNERYLLLNMLGKGGFSEVYKAFDLVGIREVAVKIHQLNSAWSEAKKQSYVKHAVREYNIHKQLRHARIVALLDIFEIDNNTFATVLELCEGGDLDWHLKQHGLLPEKECKAIASQIFAGLAYLNDPAAGRRIIHYDLKPANIMFDHYGEVKITDFGLSKIVEEGQSLGMELTSQGAGTYWYLPPECFITGSRPPIITNKVDVWSAGVMLYQMLFGKRPFGEGCSQETILRDEVMLNARSVTFPTKPAISQEAKDFISRCLAYRAADRFDIQEAASQPYLALKRPRNAAS